MAVTASEFVVGKTLHTQAELGGSPSYSGGLFDGIGDAIVDGGRRLLGGIVSTVNEVMPSAIPTATAALAQLSYMGQVGNFQSAMEDITLAGKFQQIVGDNAVYYGSPYFQRVYLNTLSGFLQCDHPEFSTTNATSVEEAAIEEFMSKGMFYE